MSCCGGRPGHTHILGQDLSVDEDVAVPKGDLFARQPDDPLDVGLVRSGGRIEDDDVTALWWIERVVPVAADIESLIRVPVHQQHLTVVQVRQHALTVDAKIEHHQPDEEKDQCGEQKCLDDLSHRSARLILRARRRLGALLHKDTVRRRVWAQSRCEIAVWCHECLAALA
jgi:hypothetical protein